MTADAMPQSALLEEGEYPFEVVKFDRLRHPGSAKLPPCNKAAVTLRFTDPDTGRTSIVTHNLFLVEKSMWQISALFCAVGLKKRDEPCVPRWNMLVGRAGRARLAIREYAASGETRKTNEVKHFIDQATPSPSPTATAPTAPTYVPAPVPSPTARPQAPRWAGGTGGGDGF